MLSTDVCVPWLDTLQTEYKHHLYLHFPLIEIFFLYMKLNINSISS